ncbi:MAG: three-Cys-motif partner protein TcmP [Thermodesulfovibrionales bacterium]
MSETFFKEKRPWSKYKDFILDYYLAPYIAKVKNLRRPILIIDCCAGPGKFEDGTEGSPIIIAKHIVECRTNGIDIKGLFLEKQKKYFKKLENLMMPHGNYIKVLQTDFTGYISKIAEMTQSHTVFLYVDPYGITELIFDELAKIYEQINKSGTSVEVLMNFNSPGFVRCGLVALEMESTPTDSENTDKFDDESFTDIQGLTLQQMDEIAGGNYWRDIVADSNLSFSEKEQKIGKLYANQMNRYYPITIDYPIKAKYHHQIPKYRLIYGTRHPDGIFLMNDIMYDARERFLKSEFADGKLFDTRPVVEQKDMMAFTKKIYEIVSEKKTISRRLVKLNAMQDFLFRYKTGDYSTAIASLLKGWEGLRLYSKSGKTRINDDELLSTKPFK